VKSPIKCGAK